MSFHGHSKMLLNTVKKVNNWPVGAISTFKLAVTINDNELALSRLFISPSRCFMRPHKGRSEYTVSH